MHANVYESMYICKSIKENFPTQTNRKFLFKTSWHKFYEIVFIKKVKTKTKRKITEYVFK